MKVETRKDHPLTLIWALLFFASIGRERMAELSTNDTILMVVLLVAYYAQIRRTILVENGLLILRKKRENIEPKLSEIREFKRAGRRLNVMTSSSRCSIRYLSFHAEANRSNSERNRSVKRLTEIYNTD